MHTITSNLSGINCHLRCAWWLQGLARALPEATPCESIPQVNQKGVLGLYWQLAQASCAKEKDRSPVPLPPWDYCFSPFKQRPKSLLVQPCDGQCFVTKIPTPSLQCAKRQTGRKGLNDHHEEANCRIVMEGIDTLSASFTIASCETI